MSWVECGPQRQDLAGEKLANQKGQNVVQRYAVEEGVQTGASGLIPVLGVVALLPNEVQV